MVISASSDVLRVTREEDGVKGKISLVGEVEFFLFDVASAFLRLVGVSDTRVSSMSMSDSRVVVEVNLRFCGESLDGSTLSGVFVGDLRGEAVALEGDDSLGLGLFLEPPIAAWTI